MRGARRRLTLEIEMRNRQAWNTASFVAAALAGKLPPFDQCFGSSAPAPGKPQSPPVLAAMGRALAMAWRAEMKVPPKES